MKLIDIIFLLLVGMLIGMASWFTCDIFGYSFKKTRKNKAERNRTNALNNRYSKRSGKENNEC